jgi:hypothetical protein
MDTKRFGESDKGEKQSRLSPEAEAALEAACKATSQAAVADRLGVSATTISHVRNGKYRGSLTTVEQRIRGVLLKQSVSCPVLGEIKNHICLEHQNRPQKFAMVNAQYMKMFRACRSGCPHSNHTKSKGDENE